MKINTFTTYPTQNFGARRLPDFKLHRDALSGFMSEIRNTSLLTREGEVALGREIQAGLTKIPIVPKWSTVTNKELLRLASEQKELAASVKELPPQDKQRLSEELKGLSQERKKLTKEQKIIIDKRDELPEEAQELEDVLSSQIHTVLSLDEHKLAQELDGISQEEQKITKRLEELFQRQQKVSSEIQSLSPPKPQEPPKEPIKNQKDSQATDSAPEANAAKNSELEDDAASEANAAKDAEAGQEFICVLSPAARQASNKLVKANLRLVVSVAKKFISTGLPFADLVQEGSLGLMKAAERFNPELGYRFSTYAINWIFQSVTRFIMDYRRTIRIPVHMSELIRKIGVAERKLTRQLGRVPSEDELAAEVGLSLEKLQKARSFDIDEPLSLDMEIYEDGKHDLADVIPDENSIDTFSTVVSDRLSEDVKVVIGSLSPNEADILNKRFGLNGEAPQTLQEIGDNTKVSEKGRGKGVRNSNKNGDSNGDGNELEHETYSRERIRQLEAKALKKIRESSAAAKLRSYLG